MIEKILFSIIGSIFFAITMKVPKKYLSQIAIGAGITSIIYSVLSINYNELISCLVAMMCLVFYCELFARILKIPATIIIMPSIIPLLPGSSIYYALFYAIHSNYDLFTKYAKETLYTGIGISLGSIISSIIIKVIMLGKDRFK